MANEFKYKITAEDETAAGVKSAQKNLGIIEKDGKRYNLGHVEREKKRIAAEIKEAKREGAEQNKIEAAEHKAWQANEDKKRKAIEDRQKQEVGSKKSLLGYVTGLRGKSLSGIVGGFGEAAEGASLLGGGLGVAALGLGAVVAGLAAAAVAAYKFSQPWINATANLANFRDMIGMAGKDIQGFELAGAQFGVDKGAMDQSLAGVGAFAHAVKFDPNANEQRALVQKTGLKIKYDANGNADIGDLALQFAELTKNQRTAYGAQHLAAMGGFTSALPAFRQGRAGLSSAMGQSLAVGGYYNDQDLVAGRAGRRSDVLAQQGLQHLVHMGQAAVAQPVMGLERLAAGGMAAVWGSPSASGPKSIADFHDAVTGKFVPAAVKLGAAADTWLQALEKNGLSKVAAVGMTASAYVESAHTFDPQIRQRGGGDGRGINQWGAARREDFARWAGHSFDTANLGEEAAFTVWELHHSTNRKVRRAGEMLDRVTDYGDAGEIASRLYEQPRDADLQASQRRNVAASIGSQLDSTGHLTIDVHIHDHRTVIKGTHINKNGRVHHFMQDSQ